MAWWTEFNYVAHLVQDTPQSIIDTLRDANINYHSLVGEPTIILGDRLDFLQNFGITHFDKVGRPYGYNYLLLLYGVYQYQDYDKEFIDFVKWIEPYAVGDSYRGYLHYQDGDHLPRLIHGDKLITLKEIIKNDEMYF